MRLPRYLYSLKNLVGSVLGLAAVGLYFGGVYHDFWYVIVPGAYVLGALATPGSPQFDAQLDAEMDESQILAGLARLARGAPRQLPADVAPIVVHLCSTLGTVLPRVLEGSGAIADAYDVKRTATEYLPKTLAAFLALPPAFRERPTGTDAKTPHQLVMEQVRLMDQKVAAMEKALVAGDTAALVANGQFLRNRFGVSLGTSE